MNALKTALCKPRPVLWQLGWDGSSSWGSHQSQINTLRERPTHNIDEFLLVLSLEARPCLESWSISSGQDNCSHRGTEESWAKEDMRNRYWEVTCLSRHRVTCLRGSPSPPSNSPSSWGMCPVGVSLQANSSLLCPIPPALLRQTEARTCWVMKLAGLCLVERPR